MRFDGLPNETLSGDKKDYHFFGRYKIPLLYASLFPNWADIEDDFPGLLPRLKGQLLVLDGHLFLLREDWKKIIDETTKALNAKNKSYFDNFISIAEQITGKVADYLAEDDAGSLKERLELLFFRTRELEYPWWYVLAMAESIETWLSKKIPSEILPGFFEPDHPTPYMEYQATLNKISKINQQKERERLIKKAAIEYRWVGMMHYWGEPNSAKKISEAAQALGDQAFQRTNSHYKKRSYEWLFPYIRQATFYRQYFAEQCSMLSLRLHDILFELSISPDSVLFLTADELLDKVNGKSLVKKAIIREREKSYGLFNTILTGQKLKKVLDKFIEKLPQVCEIRGICARKGYVRGKVCVVMSAEDVGKVHEGDILVSHETTPDIVPAMRKVSAIVTDIGGFTSHAAIVSRELGKPCVIGTKIGTRLLKDGDIVEVDAEKGVVKIIKC